MTENWEITAADFGGSYKAVAEKLDLSACTAKVIVWKEPKALSSLTENAASAQKDVVVADVSDFEEGEYVRIQDDAPQHEHNQIDTIDSDTKTLTMVNDLANSYTTTNSAIVLMRLLIFKKACGSITYDSEEDESYCHYEVAVGDFPLTAAVEGKKTEYDVRVEFTKSGFKEHDLGFKWIVHPAPPSEAS